jgi:capsular polysaccharide transport system ATP-binding protein
VIRLENVTKSYPMGGLRRYVVYKNLSLTLPARTNIGIVGRNGAGKSTLMRLIARVDRPDAGRVHVTDKARVSPPLGITLGLAQNLSGRANAKFISRLHGDSPERVEERVAHIERFVDLGEHFNLPVNSYSTGMRARLNFAIHMSFEYDYYLLDEITAVGDESFRAKAQQMFNEKKGRAAMLIVSHNLPLLRQDCQAGLYVKKGGYVKYFDAIGDAIDAYLADQRAKEPQ